MDSDELYRPLYVTDLLVNALNQDPDRPLLQLLGGPMLTVGEVRDETRDDKPTFIVVHSHIGWGSSRQDSPKAHGAPLGDERTRQPQQDAEIDESPGEGRERGEGESGNGRAAP